MAEVPGGVGFRHLVVYGINYAPEQTGVAPYTTDLAEHMATRGWRVTVVTGMPHYPQWQVADEYRGSFRRREINGAVHLRRNRHYVPVEPSAFGRALYEATFFAQAIATGHRVRPSCILGVVPSLSGGLAATVGARRWRVPLGLLFQDLVGKAAVQSGMPGGARAARPARALELWSASQADRVAVAAEAFRPYLEEGGVEPDRIRSLPNWVRVAAPAGEAAMVRRSLGWADGAQIVLHAGNMGFKQDLDNVVGAARLASSRGDLFRFVLMGNGNDRRRLESLAAGLSNLEFLDARPERSFMETLAAADVLLLNERASLVDMSLPSKITSYFLAGRPVLATVPPDGSTARELRRSGGAHIVRAGDPTALLEGLRRLAGDDALRQAIVQNAVQFALANLDRGRSLANVERFLEELVSAEDRS